MVLMPEKRAARIAARRRYPIDILRGGVGSRLDAAMAFLDSGLGHDFALRGGAKILCHVGFQRRLIAFEREQVSAPYATVCGDPTCSHGAMVTSAP